MEIRVELLLGGRHLGIATDPWPIGGWGWKITAWRYGRHFHFWPFRAWIWTEPEHQRLKRLQLQALWNGKTRA